MIALGFTNTEIHSYLAKVDLFQAIHPYDTLGIWHDYVNMAQMMDVPYDRFSNNLKKDHDLMARNYSYQKDEIIEKNLKKEGKNLKIWNMRGKSLL